MHIIRSKHGFRLSVLDVVVIAGATWSSLTWWTDSGGAIVLLPIVVGHFFFYCNVFRVRRVLELIWAVCFVGLGYLWLQRQPLDWWWLVAWAAPFTLTVFGLTIRSRDYHGVFARRLNPHLDGWLSRRWGDEPDDDADQR